ncbi:MAG: U32 family peptidase [Coriobacteriales bacterium]|nr:U32 family peptidase [Coriobacteriales bacterium]
MSHLDFSFPFNGDFETLDAQLAMNGVRDNKIREVYMNAPQEIEGSGRAGLIAHMSREELYRIVDRIHMAGVGVDLAMNSTCGGSEWYSQEHVDKVCDFIKEAHETHGLEAVTLANPFYIERVREACPTLEISVSVLADVDCVWRAQVFANAGATTICPDTAINRDLKTLAKIQRITGLQVKLMVNEGCLYKCPYRKFHMNYISHRSKEGEAEGSDFSFACGDLVSNDPAQLFRSNWVRPEELDLYVKAGAASYFKVVGRDMLKSKVLRSCNAYINQSYEGNLLDLLCSSTGFYSVEKSAYIDNKLLGSSGYFKRLSTCNRKCCDCTYCDELVHKYVRYGWVTEENLRDTGQDLLADTVIKRFGGIYPKCPDLSEKPREA